MIGVAFTDVQLHFKDPTLDQVKKALTKKEMPFPQRLSSLHAAVCLQAEGEALVSNFCGNFMFDLEDMKDKTLLDEFMDLQK